VPSYVALRNPDELRDLERAMRPLLQGGADPVTDGHERSVARGDLRGRIHQRNLVQGYFGFDDVVGSRESEGHAD